MKKLVCLWLLLGVLGVISFGGVAKVNAHSTTDDTVAYRIYSPQTGQHRYMTDLTVMNQLVIDQGWHLEKGHLLFTNDLTAYQEDMTLYTLISMKNQDVLYTSNPREAMQLQAANWRILLSTDVPFSYLEPQKGIPVYRLYHPIASRHHFTAIATEKMQLLQYGWQDEGIAFYASGIR